MNLENIKQWYIDNNLFFHASFELTQNCNFSCKHCYCPDKKHTNMSLDEAKRIVDKLFDMHCFLLIFTGGEIFTCNYFLELYLYAKQKGFIIDLITNGSLIDEKIISTLKKYPPHNISITVYGTNEDDYEIFTGNKNNYHKVMNALSLLKDNDFEFDIRTVATVDLYNSIRNGAFEELASRYNVSFRYDPIIFPKISGEKTPLIQCLSPEVIVDLEKSNSLRAMKWLNLIHDDKSFKWQCKAGVNSLSIDYKGIAYVCGMYRKEGISFLDSDIDSIVYRLNSIHNRHEELMNKSDCNNCKYRKICKWCPAYSFIYNDNELEHVDFFCKLSELRYKVFRNEL